MATLIMLLRLMLVAVAVWIMTGLPAAAHESRPIFLSLEQQAGDQWRVTWKRPMRGNTVLGLEPILPASCAPADDPLALQQAGARVEIWTVSCPGGLDGAMLAVDGLEGLLTDVLVRIAHGNGQVQIARLSPGVSTVEVTPNASAMAVALTYTALGIEHIVFGWDHLLFVVLLVVISGTLRRILWAVTGFTIAHSLTLALATLDAITVPVPLVEALIALSIAVLAAEIALRNADSLAWRAPAVIASAFGLLHGLGFASALRETGIPQHEIPLSLLFFNVGVEIGQLSVIVVMLSAIAIWRSVVDGQMIRAPTFTLLSSGAVFGLVYPIGTIAGFWTLERTVSFITS